jgi:L-aspartate oxidase
MIIDEFITAPAAVVGGGVAGLATALALEGCVVIANEPIGGGASKLAQGGIAAALGAGDSPARHAEDTLRVGAGLTDPQVAALVTGAAAGRIEWLRALGVAFDRGADGLPLLGREAGHSLHRIVHAGGDRTGAAVMAAMRQAVLARPDLRVLEGFTLIDLITAGGRVAGILLGRPDGTRVAVLAPQVVLATGGIGGIFDRTTTPSTSRGAGLAAAARHGVRLADLEFVQFHPTALAIEADPLPLLTEALRGAGAVLIDAGGDRFMTALHPDAELAPRDVVARGVHAITARGGEVFLDATGIRDLAARFPGACALARAAGLEPTRQPLPVTAAVHFHMGGIATDSHGATSLPGLWACGEVAATGLHGGNRLASNSLLEGLVFGQRAAQAIIAADARTPRGALEIPRGLPVLAADPARIAALRRQVGASLGPLRAAAPMQAALQQLEAWQPEARDESDLLLVAREVLGAALGRRESRGAHQREDYPAAAAGPALRSFRSPEPAPLALLQPLQSRVA